MFVATVGYELDGESQRLFKNAIMKQAEIVLEREPGCFTYDVCFHPRRRSMCFVYMVYESQAAFDHHLLADHYQTFDEISAPWVESKVVEIYERLEQVDYS